MRLETISIAAKVLLLAMSSPGLLAGGERVSGEIVVAEPMEITRLYSEPNGESRFANLNLSFNLMDFAPPAPPISVPEALPAKSVAIISSPPRLARRLASGACETTHVCAFRGAGS